MNPPAYFESVRTEALKDLEVWSNPRYGGVFKQLFRQVQSPKHVLSELLQNADDAGATSASVSLNNGVFEFTHNGQDFDEEQFASLCRFAYSSKKTIQTIGFRGIGFKSTFSLGKHVYLRTPTLSVRFDEEKFILPHWQDQIHQSELTVISIPEVKETVLDDLWHNFARWSEEPFSLLFQKSVRELRLPEAGILWKPIDRPAPDPGEWYSGASGQDPYLVLRSEPSPFPQDAAIEVKDERDMEARDLDNLPPCTVDIILGAPGRIYVVLPTDVITNLPFAVNAPFIQDPGRFGIKAPSVSPTNRWLLKRVGVLAAESMLAWLRDSAIPLKQRVEAYALMPRKLADRDSLADQVAAMVADAFWERLDGEEYVLTSQGTLASPSNSVFIANQLHGIWRDDSLPNIAGQDEKILCSSLISDGARTILVREADVKQVSLQAFAKKLTETSPPRPLTNDLLSKLWQAAYPSLKQLTLLNSANLVPVDGHGVLVKPGSITMLPSKPDALSDTDWLFLTTGAKAVSAQWLEYIGNPQNEDLRLIWNDMGLGKAVSLTTLVARKIDLWSSRQSDSDWFRLAHICAKCDIKVPDTMRFLSVEGNVTPPPELLGLDHKDPLSLALSTVYRSSLLLHSDYWSTFDGHHEVIQKWLSSSHSRLLSWMPPLLTYDKYKEEYLFQNNQFRIYRQIANFPYARGAQYTYQFFECRDYSFDKTVLSDETSWLTFLRETVRRLVDLPADAWTMYSKAYVLQSTTGGRNPQQARLRDDRATWLIDLANSPCIKDSEGDWKRPVELYFDNDNTNHLKGTEPFIATDYVNETSRTFLELLGVNSKPNGVERLIERLVALSTADFDSKDEAIRIYKQLDKSLPHLEPKFDRYRQEINPLASLLHKSVVLTEDHGWKQPNEVFHSPGVVKLPATPVLLQKLRGLALWQKLGIKVEPDWEDVLRYASEVQTGSLSEDDLKFVQGCLSKSPDEVWRLGKWLNCEERWVAVTSLRYRLTKDSGIKPSDLTLQFRRCTADLTRFQCSSCLLPDVLSCCDVGFEPLQVGEEQQLPIWLSLLTDRLSHVVLENDGLQQRVREKASVLSGSLWVHCRKISRVLLIEGDQVLERQGTSNVFWDEVGQRLYLTDLDEADEPEEIGKCLSEALGWRDLEKIIAYCCGRPEEQVLGYIKKRIRAEDHQAEGDQFEDDSAEDSDYEAQGTSEDEEEQDGFPAQDRGAFQPSRSVGQYQPRVKVQKHERGRPGRLIEDYAEMEGFDYAMENLYTRASDGYGLIRRKDQDFPWCIAHGRETLMQIYPLMARLGSEDVVISYERWKLLERKPDYYALLIQDDEGAPLLLTGSELLKRERAGEITCHIAEYRLSAKRHD